MAGRWYERSAQDMEWGPRHTVLLTEGAGGHSQSHCMQSGGPAVTTWGSPPGPPAQSRGSTPRAVRGHLPSALRALEGRAGCCRGRKQAARGHWCLWQRALCAVRKARSLQLRRTYQLTPGTGESRRRLHGAPRAWAGPSYNSSSAFAIPGLARVALFSQTRAPLALRRLPSSPAVGVSVTFYLSPLLLVLSDASPVRFFPFHFR